MPARGAASSTPSWMRCAFEPPLGDAIRDSRAPARSCATLRRVIGRGGPRLKRASLDGRPHRGLVAPGAGGRTGLEIDTCRRGGAKKRPRPRRRGRGASLAARIGDRPRTGAGARARSAKAGCAATVQLTPPCPIAYSTYSWIVKATSGSAAIRKRDVVQAAAVGRGGDETGDDAPPRRATGTTGAAFPCRTRPRRAPHPGSPAARRARAAHAQPRCRSPAAGGRPARFDPGPPGVKRSAIASRIANHRKAEGRATRPSAETVLPARRQPAPPPLTDALSELPAWNFGTVAAGI